MTNRIGLTILPGTTDVDAALGLGASVYLLIHAPETPAVVDAIQARQPDARILIRRWGGLDTGQSVADQIAAWYPLYHVRGVTDIVPWNEADRPAEGGFPYETIAARFTELAHIVWGLCPDIRLHWPALSEEAGYAEIGKWWDAAALADAVDGHFYRDANGIDALGRFFEAHFPGREWFVTEYSSRGLNAPPPALGVGQDAYEACRKAHLWPLCRGVIFFSWRWPGAEPGGQAEEIANDPETLAALHRAIGDFHAPEPTPPEPPAPEPEPEKSMDPIIKSMMLWQANNCRENTVEDWVRTLSLGGITTFKMKTHQAQTWMARNYSHPLAPGSVADVARLYDAFKDHGIAFVPWCVPMLLDLEAEAKLAIDVARACGDRIEIDLEVGKDFVDVPYRHRIVPYFQILADIGITVDVDTACFEGWMEALSIEEISGLVRRINAQSYWRGFNRPYEEVIRHDLATLRSVSDGEIGVVADARAPRAEMLAAATLAQSLGAVEWSCWSADMATPETYAGFALIPGRTEEEPTMDKDALWAQTVSVSQEVRDSADTAIRVATPGNTEVTEQAALDELYRISGIWQDKAFEVRDLVLRLAE